MTGKMYGYARVSSKEQNLNRQLDALAEFSMADDMVFADKASGKNFERPECKRLISTLREDDVVVVVRVGWF